MGTKGPGRWARHETMRYAPRIDTIESACRGCTSGAADGLVQRVMQVRCMGWCFRHRVGQSESGARRGAALLGNKEISARITSSPARHLCFSLDDSERSRSRIRIFIACFRRHHLAFDLRSGKLSSSSGPISLSIPRITATIRETAANGLRRPAIRAVCSGLSAIEHNGGV